MKTFSITVSTYYGLLVVDDIEADTYEEAFDSACELLRVELLHNAKLSEFYEYPD